MALSLDEVLRLRKGVQEQFGAYVHLHDACGAQTLSVEPDEMTPELRAYLEKFFQNQGAEVVFGGEGYFSVRN